jgi:glycosyltransferase involved in cell wall biosynthesis
MSTIAAMLRIRNESRWIGRVLSSLLPLTECIFVMDDHSEDDTARICGTFPSVRVMPSPFHGLDEARDKNWLLDQVRAAGRFDWVACIDGDEILEPDGARKILAAIRTRRAASALSFQVLYMWDREDQWRSDGVYGRFRRPSMFSLDRPNLRFTTTRHGGNLHCGNTPANCGLVSVTPVRLLHMGYLDRETRLRKYAWYRRVDPDNSVEDGYRHIVQGDLPDIPATARLRHAGPLTLQPFTI